MVAIRWMVVLAVGMVGSTSSGLAAEKEWSFATTTLITPCENVGANGAFGAKVRATYSTTGGTTTIQSLNVSVDSAAFSLNVGSPSASAKLEVGAVSVLLVRPWYPTIGAPSTAVDLVMPPATVGSSSPQQKPLALPAGQQPELTVSAVLIDPSGVCPLGSMSRKLDL